MELPETKEELSQAIDAISKAMNFIFPLDGYQSLKDELHDLYGDLKTKRFELTKESKPQSHV